MTEMRFAVPSELAETEELWSRAFGDPPELQREFYRLCAWEGALTLREDGRLAAMLAMPEVTLVLPDGRSARAGYVYALATRPDARGRGHAARLMEYAHGLMARRGLDCSITVPAQPSLFRFFARQGYEPAFSHRRVLAHPGPGPAWPLSPAEYAALREQLLAGRIHVAQPEGQLVFQKLLCGAGGGLYRLPLPHGDGCAAVETGPEGTMVKELLCAQEDEGTGAAWAAGLGRGPAVIRMPALGGDGMPFAALRWLRHPPPCPWEGCQGYFGLAFD